MYIDGDETTSNNPGASEFSLIICSKPLPIEITINSDGIKPRKVDQKKV